MGTPRSSSRRPSPIVGLSILAALALAACGGAAGRGADDIPDPPTLTVPDLYAPIADAGPDAGDAGAR